MSSQVKYKWMDDEDVQTVMAALAAKGNEARFVGGCVRDSLIGRPVHDIDIATPELPEITIKLLEDKGIKAIPTGIDHGTITGVINKRPFEITSLRRDVATDGRRAVVAFTTDWLEDANRRDFTFNAMSLDRFGNLFDPFGGEDDLRAGLVKFVGNAEMRIREDYLRLLRFFRFSAYFAKTSIDPEALEACRAQKSGLSSLSGERISQEFLKLLQAPRAAKWVGIMKKEGVLDLLLPETEDLHHLEMMCAFEEQPDAIRRLAILLSASGVEACVKRFRLSKAQARRLIKARCQDDQLLPQVFENLLRAFLYRNDAQTARDQLFIYWAEKGFYGLGPAEQGILEKIDLWDQNPAIFPLKGKDLIERGFQAGPELGHALKAIENWWCEEGCYADRESCLEQLSREHMRLS